MADDIIGNMFGVDPDQLRMQRYQQAQAQNMQMAQMDPFQRASAQMANAGSGLMMLGAQAAGLKTPQERLAEVRQQAMAGLDPNDVNSIKETVQRLYQAGDTPGATMLAKRAREAEIEASKLAYEAAMTEKANRVPEVADVNIGTTGGGIPVYADKNGSGQYIWKDGIKTPFSGKLDMKADTGGSKSDNAFETELAKQDARVITKAREKYDGNLSQLDTYSKLNSLNNKDLITGTYAQGRTGITNLFSTLGLASQEDAAKLGSTQVFAKVAGDLVLDKVKALGFNPSNADKEFVEKLIPNLEQSPEARKALIDFLNRKSQLAIKEFEYMDKYAREKKSLTGYKPLSRSFASDYGSEGDNVRQLSATNPLSSETPAATPANQRKPLSSFKK